MTLRGLLTRLICALFAVVVMTAASSACCDHSGSASDIARAHAVGATSGHHDGDTSRHPTQSHAKQACATLCCAPLAACVQIGPGAVGDAPQALHVFDAGAGALFSPSPPPPRTV